VSRRRGMLAACVGIVVALSACQRLPAPAVELLSYREFGWLGLVDVDAVSTMVNLSGSGDQSVGHVDTEILASLLREQLGACGVPLNPPDESARPLLDVRVAVRQVHGGFAYYVDVNLYRSVKMADDTLVDYSVWGEDTLGSTRHLSIAELNSSVRSSVRGIVDTFCAEYREGQARRGRRTSG
jgi:hypothetical protein